MVLEVPIWTWLPVVVGVGHSFWMGIWIEQSKPHFPTDHFNFWISGIIWECHLQRKDKKMVPLLRRCDDSNDFEEIFTHQLDQISSEQLTDEHIQALSLLCGSEVLLAALELLDLKAGRFSLWFGISRKVWANNTDNYSSHLGLVLCLSEVSVKRLRVKSGQMIYEVHPWWK